MEAKLCAGCRNSLNLIKNRIPVSNVTVIGDESTKCCGWQSRWAAEVEVAEGPQVIERGVFSGSKLLKRVVLPSTVKRISYQAFKDCTNLVQVVFSDAAETTTIEQQAFRGCIQLRILRIPPLVTKLERNTFDGCIHLFSLELPEQLECIENFTFSLYSRCIRNIVVPPNCKVGLNNNVPKNSLKQRFDGRPIHQMCYYQSAPSVIEYLSRPMSSAADRRAIATGMLQDGIGMTPLHILACRTKQNVELYRMLLDIYPENLIMKDEWGDLPILYAFWGDAPEEVVQLLADCHKTSFSDHVLDWGGMVATLATAGSTFDCPSFRYSIQNLLRTKQTVFPDHPLDWEALVTGLVNDGDVSKSMFRFLLKSAITNRLERLGVGKWRDKMIIESDNWIYHHEREERVKKIFSNLASYEHQNEVTSLLELALWKAKIDQSNSANPASVISVAE